MKFIEQFTEDRKDGRWLLMSDVCKHCVHAACLEVCPTGAIMRTEFDTVVIQSDACNGCRDCISACPFGVIDINPASGLAQKCTLCYDRLQSRHGAGLLESLPDRFDSVRHDQELRGEREQARRSNCTRPARSAPISTAPTRRCLAGSTRFTCWWINRKSTACRRIRRCRRAIWLPVALFHAGRRFGRLDRHF